MENLQRIKNINNNKKNKNVNKIFPSAVGKKNRNILDWLIYLLGEEPLQIFGGWALKRSKFFAFLYFMDKELPTWFSGKESACPCRRCRKCRFSSWVGKIHWIRNLQPTSVLLPGKIPWTEDPGRYSPWGHKDSDTTEQLRAFHVYSKAPDE